MGANIRGAGTNVIKIEGVERLEGKNYTIIPDPVSYTHLDVYKRQFLVFVLKALVI